MSSRGDRPTAHDRARAALSDRLDDVLDAGEGSWLDDHLHGCRACRRVAAAYEADRAALRKLRSTPPIPPRDLWARTAAAIEREPRFRERRVPATLRRRSITNPAALVTALVAVVVVGTLTSSRLPGGDRPTASESGRLTALASSERSIAAATPIPLGGRVRYVSQGEDGQFSVRTVDVKSVCASNTEGCAPPSLVGDQPVAITSEPLTVFGSATSDQLIVVDEAVAGESTISVVAVDAAEPTESVRPAASPSDTSASTPPPSAVATATAAARPTLSPVATPSVPTGSATPVATPSVAAATSPPPSSSPPSGSGPASTEPSFPSTVPVTPSPTPEGAVLIADDVVLVGQSAAYSPSGAWFAFTARPAHGSSGSDIYVWKVGDRAARAVTTDHRSAFASWLTGDVVVGSSVVDVETTGSSSDVHQEAVSFLLDPASGSRVPEPQTGRTWRPSVDPTGRQAVYWVGSLRKAADSDVYVPDAGRLVLGDWDTGTAAATASPAATPLVANQSDERHETTIAAGRIADWDARWDPTGSKVAIWIADADDPDVGELSLYAVDVNSGRIDLRRPILDAVRARAGFSISTGKLVWAAPSADGSKAGGRILVLGWTANGTGTIETLPDKVVVIR